MTQNHKFRKGLDTLCVHLSGGTGGASPASELGTGLVLTIGPRTRQGADPSHNQKLGLESDTAHQKPGRIRNQHASETSASEASVFAGVVRREHPWPNHDNVHGLMRAEHKAYMTQS